MKNWPSSAILSLVLFLAVAGFAATQGQLGLAAIAALSGFVSAGVTLAARLRSLTQANQKLAEQLRALAAGKFDGPVAEDLPSPAGEAARELTQKLLQLQEHVRAAAGGVDGKATPEMGDFSKTIADLSQRHRLLVHEISHTSVHLATATEQILAVLNDQEFAATHQASSVEETQRTMETLLSSAKRIAESAQTVFKSAERTQANNRNVADRIGELKNHSERIAEILEVIKAIADRSDLLALNASLEGLRAGEAGKGFSLVAAEMRRLSETIKDSVSDIKELLDDIRESSMSSVMATEEGTNLSEKTTESALKITLITQQQQSGTEQVTQSMDELSALISQGVAGTRQLSLAATELVHMAEDLRAVVNPVPSVKPRKTDPNVITRVSRPTPDASSEIKAPTAIRPRKRDDQPTLDLSNLTDSEETQLDKLSANWREKPATSPLEKPKSFDEQLDDLEKDIDT